MFVLISLWNANMITITVVSTFAVSCADKLRKNKKLLCECAILFTKANKIEI